MIFDDRRTYQPTGPMRNRKSTTGPAGKKSSLTPEATMIGKSKEADRMVSINYALPSMPKYFGHFREHAQITDEETEVSQRKLGMNKQPIGILQQRYSTTCSSKANTQTQIVHFFRWLSHAASTTTSTTTTSSSSSCADAIASASDAVKASLPSVDATSSHGTLSAPSSITKQGPLNNHKLLRPNSLTNINRADTPAKLIKRTGRPSNNYDPSPGIGAAVEKQFGSVGSRTPYSGAENYSPADVARMTLWLDRCRPQRDERDGGAGYG